MRDARCHILFNTFNPYLPPSSFLSQAFLRSFWVEMEEENANSSQPNRCYLDRFQQTNIVEWNKKRKLQTEQLDLPRQKHKCWARRFSCENGSTSDDISEPKSSRGSNSFGEDSDTAISVNEEGKLQIDCAKPYLHGRPSHGPLEVDRVSERESFCDALMNLEEQSLALGICSDHVYSEYVRDGNMHSIEKEFEDVFSTFGAIPNMYILSSGKWNVNQEAQSNARPPTIDEEFEQYFSMLML